MYYGIQGLYPAAKVEDFVFPGFYHFFEFDRAQAQAFAGFNFQMTIEMLDAFDDAVAFSHAGAGSQGDCVALLSAADLSMGFMGIAPGRAAVDEGFKLAGNVRPIGGSNRDDAVCPLKFVDDFVHVVMLDTLRGVVTGAAAFAEAETVIINADAFERIFFPRHWEMIFTISAVAPFLTGLQFITRAFIFSLHRLKIVKKKKPQKRSFFVKYADYLLEN